MFESFSEPLPDLEKALDRIGLSGVEIKNDLPSLDMLINSFLHNVPYENLEVSYFHRAPSLKTKDLYEKIVTNHRGGYCFEMNGFFWALLRDLGFEVYSVSAYVLEYQTELGDLEHRGNIVIIDDKKYFVDVGWGGKNKTRCAVPLAGKVRGGFFIKYNASKREYKLYRIVDPEEEKASGHGNFIKKKIHNGESLNCISLILFRDFIAYPQEFNLVNMAVPHITYNPIATEIICNIEKIGGSVYSLTGNTLKVKNGDEQFTQTITDDDELKSVLQKYFDITI